MIIELLPRGTDDTPKRIECSSSQRSSINNNEKELVCIPYCGCVCCENKILSGSNVKEIELMVYIKDK